MGARIRGLGRRWGFPVRKDVRNVMVEGRALVWGGGMTKNGGTYAGTEGLEVREDLGDSHCAKPSAFFLWLSCVMLVNAMLDVRLLSRHLLSLGSKAEHISRRASAFTATTTRWRSCNHTTTLSVLLRTAVVGSDHCRDGYRSSRPGQLQEGESSQSHAAFVGALLTSQVGDVYRP